MGELAPLNKEIGNQNIFPNDLGSCIISDAPEWTHSYGTAQKVKTSILWLPADDQRGLAQIAVWLSTQRNGNPDRVAQIVTKYEKMRDNYHLRNGSNARLAFRDLALHEGIRCETTFVPVDPNGAAYTQEVATWVDLGVMEPSSFEVLYQSTAPAIPGSPVHIAKWTEIESMNWLNQPQERRKGPVGALEM